MLIEARISMVVGNVVRTVNRMGMGGKREVPVLPRWLTH